MPNVLAHKALLANLSMSSWGIRRKEDAVADEVLTRNEAQKEFGLFTKRLLNKSAMKALRQVRHSARAYHHMHTAPWMNDGTRILPTALYPEYTKQMGTYKDEFDTAVKEFIKSYPGYIEQAKKELGKLFREADYPSAASLKAKFQFDIIICNCPDSSDFRANLDDHDLKQIKANWDKRLGGQLDAAVKDVGQRLAEVVQHMVDRLKAYKPGDKAKNKKAEGLFRDSLVSNIRELADLIPAFNMADDPKLAAIHKAVIEKLCEHDADALREDDNARKVVAKSADAILKQINAFIA
jgi:hypothetical protein